MKSQKIIFLAVAVLLESCAAGYRTVNPPSLNYQSESSDKSVTLDYKYGVYQGTINSLPFTGNQALINT